MSATRKMKNQIERAIKKQCSFNIPERLELNLDPQPNKIILESGRDKYTFKKVKNGYKCNNPEQVENEVTLLSWG